MNDNNGALPTKTLVMPSFGADMARGTLVQWQVEREDEVKKGQVIATIETMKGLIDMEAFDEGRVEALLVANGETVTVGTPIARLALSRERSDASTPDRTTPVAPGSPLLISPAARRVAQERGITWQSLTHGSGPNGAIVLGDIDKLTGTTALSSLNADKPMLCDEEASGAMRRAIAATVSRSKRDIPHYYLMLAVNFDNSQRWLTHYNEHQPPEQRLLANALIYCAIARALGEFPQLNGYYQQERFVPARAVHLGQVINLRGGGLMVAAIAKANQLGPIAMMEKLKDQVERSKKGGLRMSELQSATVTVSSLGERGVDGILGVIFPPQVALIGVGRPRKAPAVIEGELRASHLVNISLSGDHRVSDGHLGSRFLNRVNQWLQQPEAL